MVIILQLHYFIGLYQCGGNNLTKLFSAIVNPIAWLFGQIIDILANALGTIGITNIAITIIVFTLLIKLLMLPLTVKQSKMMKLNSIITPEVKVIQDKYKNAKSDPAAMQKMQAEIKAVYEKYGTSQMGGCVQLLIQMPILLAMYQVIQQIPMYVGNLKVLFLNIFQNTNGGIMSVSNYNDLMTQNFEKVNNVAVDWTNVDKAVNAMNSFKPEQWTKLKELFPAYADIINQNHAAINHMNTFFGVNVSQNPTFGLSVGVLIPILSGLTQYISVKISQGQTQMDDDNPAAASMKMMTLFMPLMSVFFAFSLPAGLGLYWIATAVFQTILQLIVNRYYDKIGTETIVKKNIERRNKKLIKKGIDPQSIAKNATTSTKKIDNMDKNQQRIKSLQEKKAENDKKIQDIKNSTSYYKSGKPGSLAEKANMVSKFNDKSDKKK